MPDPDQVVSLFRELVGDRAARLDGSHYPADINSRITEALSEGRNEDEKEMLRTDSIGFHLVDWQREAAFIVALVLFPERFTNAEIREEIDSFLAHVPAHVIEAARLAGHQVDNIFRENGE